MNKIGFHKGWDISRKAEECMAVVCFCAAGASVLFAAWAVVVGWSAVIERLAAR